MMLVILCVALSGRAFTVALHEGDRATIPINPRYFDTIYEDKYAEYAVNETTKEAVVVWEEFFSDSDKLHREDIYFDAVYLPMMAMHDTYKVIGVYVERWNQFSPVCNWVNTVYLPATAKWVIMWDIPRVNKISIPEGIEWLGGFRFYAGETLKLPKSMRKLEREFLSYSENLRSFSMGEVEQIDSYTLFHCTALTDLDLGTCVNDLSRDSFSELYSLEQIVIPESVGYIRDNVFSDCTALKTITLPMHPITMQEAFTNLPALESIILPCEVPYDIHEEAFQGVDFDKCILYVPKGCGEAYSQCKGWNRFRIMERELSGIETAEATEDDGEDTVYYDMTGQRVDAPASGQILVRCKGDVSSKVIIP